MARYSATGLDLSRIDRSSLFTALDYEAILDARIVDLKARFDAAGVAYDVETLETDASVILQQTGAYRELLTRQSIQDAQADVLLAFARGAFLDRLGDAVGTARQEGELDDRYRARIQLAPEAFATAGTPGGYIYHAMSASPDVRDIGLVVLDRGTPEVTVEITVMSRVGDGVPSAGLMEAVRSAVMNEGVKLATDVISLRSAVRVPYALSAILYTRPGPDPALVRSRALASAHVMAERYRRLAGGVPSSALIGALQLPEVDRVALLSPASGIATERWQFAAPASFDLTVEVLDD